MMFEEDRMRPGEDPIKIFWNPILIEEHEN